jgi:hypothetical protein
MAMPVGFCRPLATTDSLYCGAAGASLDACCAATGDTNPRNATRVALMTVFMSCPPQRPA